MDSSCIARVFWRLNPSSLIDSSGTSAKSAGMGNACTTEPRVTNCAPNRSDKRFNNTIPRSTDTCWHAIELTSASKTVEKRGGHTPENCSTKGRRLLLPNARVIRLGLPGLCPSESLTCRGVVWQLPRMAAPVPSQPDACNNQGARRHAFCANQ